MPRDPYESAVVIGPQITLRLQAKQSFWRSQGDIARYEREGFTVLVVTSLIGGILVSLFGMVLMWALFRDLMVTFSSLIMWAPLGASIAYLFGRRIAKAPLWFFTYSEDILHPVVCRDLLQDYLHVPASDKKGHQSPMVYRASHLYEIVKQRAIRRKFRVDMSGLQKIQIGLLIALVVIMAILLFFVIAQTSGQRQQEQVQDQAQTNQR